MYFIVEKFSELMGREIASQTIWDHLDEMYDMDTLVSCGFSFVISFHLISVRLISVHFHSMTTHLHMPI